MQTIESGQNRFWIEFKYIRILAGPNLRGSHLSFFIDYHISPQTPIHLDDFKNYGWCL